MAEVDAFAVEGPRREGGAIANPSSTPALPLSLSRSPSFAAGSGLLSSLRATMASGRMFDLGLDNIDLWRSEEMQLVQVRRWWCCREQKSPCRSLCLANTRARTGAPAHLRL